MPLISQWTWSFHYEPSDVADRELDLLKRVGGKNIQTWINFAFKHFPLPLSPATAHPPEFWPTANSLGKWESAGAVNSTTSPPIASLWSRGTSSCKRRQRMKRGTKLSFTTSQTCRRKPKSHSLLNLRTLFRSLVAVCFSFDSHCSSSPESQSHKIQILKVYI